MTERFCEKNVIKCATVQTQRVVNARTATAILRKKTLPTKVGLLLMTRENVKAVNDE